MTALDDLLAACDALETDTRYAVKTRTLAAAFRAWAPTVASNPYAFAPDTGPVLLQEDFAAPLDVTTWDVKSRVSSESKTVFEPVNVFVHDGMLDIVAHKDAAGQWHGGEIQSLAPSHQYVGPHFIEARAKLPAGVGTWSAPIWEWGAPWGGNAVEVDVCEQLGKDPLGWYHVTLHEGLSGKKVSKIIETGVDLTAAPHTFGAAVRDDEVEWYFDGEHRETTTKDECFAAGFTTWPFTTTPMVCLSDLDMGGWGGTPTITGPVHMLVDLVRVTKL